MASDNDTRIGYGRRNASSSSSRESSPAAGRQKRSFTPNSDDGDHVVPAPVQDNADTPSPDETPAPLIRQAVGFSWQPSVLPTANVNTYQAVLPTNPNAIQFLPGQAPPKKKKKRAKPEYSAQTSRFRLVAEPTPASTPEPSMQPALYTGPGPYSSMYRFTSATSPSASVTMSTPSVADTASPAAEIHSPAVASTQASIQRIPYNMTPEAYNNIAAAGPSRSHAQGQAGAPATNTRSKRSKKSTGQRTGSSAQSPVLSAQQQQQQPPSTTYHQAVQPSHYRHESNTGSHERSAAPSASAGPVRPLRMLTILIEDVRSGVPDHQLAEVQVHLRPGEDPDGGFWANAKEMCEKLQAGPSRIDGPARVYTLRGKYRQFFMRVDADNVLEAESCNLGVSNERTLEVVVEAPPPKGQLPLPPRVPQGFQPTSDTDSDIAQSPPPQYISRLAMYPGPPVNPLSQSDHRTQKRKRHSKSQSSAHHKTPRSSLQGTPSPNHMPRRRRQSKFADRDSSSSFDEEDEERELSPPVLGRLADTVEEREEAITKFIRPDIENDKEWPRCMSIISRGGPKRISDMLWCYNFVESKVKECEDRTTPPQWDGAPNCWVERRHVWRVLNVSPEWGEECRTVLKLVDYYGKTGRRYQDPLINRDLDSTDPPTEKTWKRFVKLLHTIDSQYNRTANGGE